MPEEKDGIVSRRCVYCRADLVEKAQFCHRCGRPIDETPDVVPRDESMRGARASTVDPQEREIWRGAFSAKAMIGHWIAGGFLTIALPVVANLAALEPSVWSLLPLVIAVIWVVLLVWYLYLRWDTQYVLTNQRLLHMHGILSLQTNRVETIDIDDVSTHQTILERFLDVGTIEVVSSDATDPVLVLRGIDHAPLVAQWIDDARRAERLRRGIHIESLP